MIIIIIILFKKRLFHRFLAVFRKPEITDLVMI